MEREEESKRLGIGNHTLHFETTTRSETDQVCTSLCKGNKSKMLPGCPYQGLPDFLWKEYEGKNFKIRCFDWPNHQGIPYKHFYIEGPEDRGRCIRFEFRPYPINSEKENNPYMDKDIFLYSFLPPNKTHATDTEFSMTQDVWNRMNIVCSATNFSFCLRNSEHLVNYIVLAKWNCNQMQMEDKLRVHFDGTLDVEDRKLIALLPKELKTLEENKMANSQRTLFDELEGSIRFEKKLNVEEFNAFSEFKKRAYNIIFAGPTGAGKSTLINLAFNETVCKTDVDTSSSVTREVTVLSGKYKCKDSKDIRVNIFDTMGVCDTYLNNDEVIHDLMEAIDTDKSKVVIVCSGVIKRDQKEAIQKFLQNLDYENNKDNFIFLYNKSEGMKQDDKEDGLDDMGEALKVDLNYEITFSVPDATGNRTAMKYYAGCCTGFNTEQYDDDCVHTFRVLKDRILPDAYDDHRKGKIKVPS